MDLVKRIKKKIKKRSNAKRFPTSILSSRAIFDDYTKLEGENLINHNSNISSSEIGRCTVIGNNNNLSNCKIGRFCSIANNVNIISATHPIEFVSSFPGFFKTENNYPFGKGVYEFDEYIKCNSGYFAEIGNDVWIGTSVIIKGGVKIGDGAIIGMGSVVTKNVPPYAIVGGFLPKLLNLDLMMLP